MFGTLTGYRTCFSGFAAAKRPHNYQFVIDHLDVRYISGILHIRGVSPMCSRFWWDFDINETIVIRVRKRTRNTISNNSPGLLAHRRVRSCVVLCIKFFFGNYEMSTLFFSENQKMSTSCLGNVFVFGNSLFPAVVFGVSTSFFGNSSFPTVVFGVSTSCFGNPSFPTVVIP